jgi:hypothetical protein
MDLSSRFCHSAILENKYSCYIAVIVILSEEANPCNLILVVLNHSANRQICSRFSAEVNL